MFDITNRRSFQNVHDWLEEARSHVQPHSIVFLLVGHKCDLEAQRQVSATEVFPCVIKPSIVRVCSFKIAF